jgi:hypothetical protein
MTSGLARWLVRLYPRAWRERYGEEFSALLQDSPGGLRAVLNVLSSALRERFAPSRTPLETRLWGSPALEAVVNPFPDSILSLTRKPSAFIPMVMSLTALAVVLASVLRFGVVHEADEGASAHIYQLLMAGQLPILAYFVVRWLPRVPRQTLSVLALQLGAALAALAPVYLLGL